MLLNIPKKIEDDINSFCKLNKIENIDEFIVSCIIKGYSIAKYGETPMDNYNKENKPLEFEKYEENESITQGMEGEQTKKKPGRPKKQKPSTEEKVEPIKEEEPIKVKKKIRILKD